MDHKNSFILTLLRRFVGLLPRRQRLRIIELMVSVLQESLPANMAAPATTENAISNGSICAFPHQLQQFEKLYDPHSGGWNVPSPLVRINQYDRRLYPNTSYDSVELEVGQFYYSFVKLVQPVNILETGVARGYSASCMAAALTQTKTGGHIYSIDPAFNLHLWDNTPLEAYVTWIPKRSQDALDDVNMREYDLLIIDSNHDYDTCIWEVMNFERLLRIGGYILLHDSLYFDGVGAVVKQLMVNPRFEVVTVPTPRTHGNPQSRRPGVTIVHKLESGEPLIEYKDQYKGWFVGDPNTPAFLHREKSSY